VRENSAELTTGGMFVDSSGFTAHTCEIERNGVGLTVQGLSRALADARHNWWGDATGPHHPTLNPTGMGDAITDGAQFVPWNTVTGLDDWSLPVPTT